MALQHNQIRPSVSSPGTPETHDVPAMFDRISGSYDLLNRLLSFGIDSQWRKSLIRSVNVPPEGRVLDLATGTGDVLIELMKSSHKPKLAVGIDMAGKMLAIGREKLRAAGLNACSALTLGDAMSTGFLDEAFDAVTVAFGIRNMPDLSAALRECRRVLKPGGRMHILEFSLPTNALVHKAYLFYFRHVLPLAGRIVSRDPQAYRYLNRSVEAFPFGEALCNRIKAAGFDRVTFRPFTCGIATLYEGIKPDSTGQGKEHSP